MTIYDHGLSRFMRQGVALNRPPIFILGSGRNGSTLLSCILNNHEEICIPAEHDFIPMLIKQWCKRPSATWKQKVHLVLRLLDRPSMWDLNKDEIGRLLLNYSMDKQTIEHVVQLVYAQLMRQQNKPGAIWGKRTPVSTYYSTSLKKTFPNAKMLFLIRDPRDVINSFSKTNDNLSRSHFLIWRWKNAVQRYCKLTKKYPQDTIRLKHEDLVRNPHVEITKILAWLNMLCPEDICHDHQKNMPALGVTEAKHHQKIRLPVTDASVGLWRNELPHEMVQLIESRCRDEMLALNYFEN